MALDYLWPVLGEHVTATLPKWKLHLRIRRPSVVAQTRLDFVPGVAEGLAALGEADTERGTPAGRARDQEALLANSPARRRRTETRLDRYCELVVGMKRAEVVGQVEEQVPATDAKGRPVLGDDGTPVTRTERRDVLDEPPDPADADAWDTVRYVVDGVTDRAAGVVRVADLPPDLRHNLGFIALTVAKGASADAVANFRAPGP